MYIALISCLRKIGQNSRYSNLYDKQRMDEHDIVRLRMDCSDIKLCLGFLNILNRETILD